MHTIEELRQLLVIDRDKLEEELVRQPQLFAEVADYYAEAVNKREVSKQSVERSAADLAGQFRSASLDKVTATQVSDHVNSNPIYIEYTRQYINYRTEADRLQGLKDAFAQRASMLRDLVSLFSTGYWGQGIPVKKEMIESYAQRYKEHRQRVED